MMKLYDLISIVKAVIRHERGRQSAWKRGVFEYELDMLDKLMELDNVDIENIYQFKRACLNGAKDFYELSDSGFYFIYDSDIAKRLCNNTELKRTKNGKKQPNKFETWLDVQGRALCQAYVDLEIHAARYLMRRCNHDKL